MSGLEDCSYGVVDVFRKKPERKSYAIYDVATERKI